MKPVHIDFKPSYALTLIIFTLGSGATGMMLMLPDFSWQLRRLLCWTIFMAVIYHICQYGLLLLPGSCVSLKIDSSSHLQVLHRNGELLSVDVSQDTVVTPYLTVINCKKRDGHLFARLFGMHVVILPDMLDVESYRQLRVWLRWSKPGG